MRINKKDIGAFAVFAALILCFALLISGITGKESSRELQMVRDAVKNAALTCYAVEGTYPAELEYLQENYHLSYNKERYIVYYDAFASNLMPDIKVAERGANEP